MAPLLSIEDHETLAVAVSAVKVGFGEALDEALNDHTEETDSVDRGDCDDEVDTVGTRDSLLDVEELTVSVASAVRDMDFDATGERVVSNDTRALTLSGAVSVAEPVDLAVRDGRVVCDSCEEECAESVDCLEATSVALPRETEAVADMRGVALSTALEECRDESMAELVAADEEDNVDVGNIDCVVDEEDDIVLAKLTVDNGLSEDRPVMEEA